ncbi:MAG: hypothetical protein EA388_16045 [Nitriliruptor sp.]|nr:MAG: hypothetical protein EA388_16045 [Nitriliruptor sp.]
MPHSLADAARLAADPAARAGDLIADLPPLLERRLDGPIEHLGSTAVAGVAAKPVIAVWRTGT